MNYIYFETSAINYLLDNYNDEQIVFIRDCIKAITKGKICMSPISMWEIGCTGSESRREDLIRICQVFFDEFTLFPDPIQVIDHFISEGCPKIETQKGFYDNEGSFEDVWRSIAGDLNKTIIINGNIKEMDKEVVKQLSILIQNLLKNNFAKKEIVGECNFHDCNYQIACDAIEEIYSRLEFVRENKANGEESSNSALHKLAILFAHAILNFGITFGSMGCEDFWSKRNITDGKKRAEYLFGENETIVFRGPFVYMALMAESQTACGGNRGLYKDCLHSMYMPYCASFFTNDKHFLQLKSMEPSDLWGRINSIEEFCNSLFFEWLPRCKEEMKNGTEAVLM